MGDPIIVQDTSHAAADAATHVVSAAGGGGILAAILNFFTQREARAAAVRLAVLEKTVDALHRRVDDLQDEVDHQRGVTPRKKRRRT